MNSCSKTLVSEDGEHFKFMDSLLPDLALVRRVIRNGKLTRREQLKYFKAMGKEFLKSAIHDLPVHSGDITSTVIQ